MTGPVPRRTAVNGARRPTDTFGYRATAEERAKVVQNLWRTGIT